jgi:hypothetical protein
VIHFRRVATSALGSDWCRGRHQSLATFVSTGQRHDLAEEMLDAIIQLASVSGKVLDDARLD